MDSNVGIHEHCTAAENLVHIWQRNRFSHPNIAEVVYAQVTPRDKETNLNMFFKAAI
jgi:hypothetical protein